MDKEQTPFWSKVLGATGLGRINVSPTISRLKDAKAVTHSESNLYRPSSPSIAVLLPKSALKRPSVAYTSSPKSTTDLPSKPTTEASLPSSETLFSTPSPQPATPLSLSTPSTLSLTDQGSSSSSLTDDTPADTQTFPNGLPPTFKNRRHLSERRVSFAPDQDTVHRFDREAPAQVALAADVDVQGREGGDDEGEEGVGKGGGRKRRMSISERFVLYLGFYLDFSCHFCRLQVVLWY
ncbi:hypothetical protein HDV00_000857 [Rhizophlyctis rosea]|nr:hypothetical protein HDV00_000857 [Rhizophlyctis rosea]